MVGAPRAVRLRQGTDYHRMVTRAMRVAGPAVLAAAALVSVLAALAFGGGADAEPLIDPGAITRYGLPITKLVMNLGVAVALGALALAVFALRPGKPGQSAGSGTDEFGLALDIAAAGAGVWTVAAATSGLFAFSSVAYLPITFDDAYGQGLGVYLTQTEPGRAWLITTDRKSVV